MEWLKRKGMDKWFQRENLIILILSGVLLFIISLPTEDGNATRGKVKEAESETTQQTVKEEKEDDFDYVAYLEDRLEKMLSGMEGVGQVAVMITLQSSEELVIEKDVPEKSSEVEETDSGGGMRVTTQSESSEATVYRTEGNISEPYVVKKILPRIEGVLVVAQGAGNGDLNRNITEVVQALFDVEAHKVKVVSMERAGTTAEKKAEAYRIK